MALDFYNLDDTSRKERLFQLSESELNSIEATVKEYKNLTGLYLDPYGKTRVYRTHIELIMKLLKKQLDNKNFGVSNNQTIQGVLKKFESAQSDIIAIGD